MPQVPVAQLKDYIGKELGHSEWLTVDQQRVNQFARNTRGAKAPDEHRGTIAHPGHRLGRRVSYLVDHETVSPQKRTSGVGQNTNPKPHPAKPEICSYSELLFV